MPVIGFLRDGTFTGMQHFVGAFREKLKEAGFAGFMYTPPRVNNETTTTGLS